MPTLVQKGRLAWGKVRRFMLIAVFQRKAAADLSRRRGQCIHCGACCKLLFKCPAFRETSTGGWCTIYDDRPGVCALFPINEKDLRERDILMPEKSCGFSFVKDENGLFRPRDLSPLNEPLRRLKSNPRRHKIITSTLAIFLSRFKRSA